MSPHRYLVAESRFSIVQYIGSHANRSGFGDGVELGDLYTYSRRSNLRVLYSVYCRFSYKEFDIALPISTTEDGLSKLSVVYAYDI